jgi:antitoxin component of MazEF toxin-antitoxin module
LVWHYLGRVSLSLHHDAGLGCIAHYEISALLLCCIPNIVFVKSLKTICSFVMDELLERLESLNLTIEKEVRGSFGNNQAILTQLLRERDELMRELQQARAHLEQIENRLSESQAPRTQ